MTQFDIIFDSCAKQSGLAWYLVDKLPQAGVQGAKQYKYPCIWRNFNEQFQPLFNLTRQVEREMSLYFVEIGFTKKTKEMINEDFENLMTKYVSFRDLMYRRGIDLQFTQKPFPNWKQTDYDEYGIVFNLTAKYSECLTA